MSREIPRSWLKLASTSSMKMAGTTSAGEITSDKPASVTAEKPKPAKPRTAPAEKTTKRLKTSTAGPKGGIRKLTRKAA
jgi:hypothetical protein